MLRAGFRFYFIQLQRLECSVASLPFLLYPAAPARISGHFTLSVEAKSASRSSAPMTCDSEQAASAFTSPNQEAFPARICLLRLVFDHYDHRLELLLLSLLQLLLYLNLQLLRWNLIIL